MDKTLRRRHMSKADELDQHIADTADMARDAMATVLSSLHSIATAGSPGMALKSASVMQASVSRMEESMSAARQLINDGDDAAASVDCARVMALSDYTNRLARLRRIAAQINAYDEAQSGNAS
jgi:hypothetical protein